MSSKPYSENRRLVRVQGFVAGYTQVVVSWEPRSWKRLCERPTNVCMISHGSVRSLVDAQVAVGSADAFHDDLTVHSKKTVTA